MNLARTGVLLAAVFLAFSTGISSRDISFAYPPIFHRFDPRISALYALVYMPDYPIEVNNRETGTIDTVPISELLTPSMLDIPYRESNGSFRVFMNMRFKCDTAYLKSLGVRIGLYWNHQAPVVFPLSLVPTLDTMSCVMGTEIETNAPMQRVKIPLVPLKIIGSDTCKQSFAGGAFLIEIKDSTSLNLHGLIKDLKEVFKPINAYYSLSCGYIFNGQSIILDSLRHMNMLKGNTNQPVFFFDYTGERAKAEKAFEEFVDSRPGLGKVLEMRFVTEARQ